jgi:hypothetical protein
MEGIIIKKLEEIATVGRARTYLYIRFRKVFRGKLHTFIIKHNYREAEISCTIET